VTDAAVPPPLRLALLDDQLLVLRGLSRLLVELGFDVVAEASEASQLLRALATARVDVVISDIRMPGTDGLQLIRLLRERACNAPVILLTTFNDHELLLRAINAGAAGLLLKDAAPDELQLAVRRVAAGEVLLQPISGGPVRAGLSDVDRQGLAGGASATQLTERERSILRLVAGGYSNKEIARSLQLTEGTIKNYISEILTTLDSRDRTHAVLKAITQRLI
jgi:DNA-binding NarL/FixJ family response regulator